MIRLNGQEAVNQAYYAMNNRNLLSEFSTFYLESWEMKIPLLPEQALAKLKSGEARIESLICEVQSVWDVLLAAEKERTLFVHPCQHSVLVLNREHGGELGPGIHAFAVDMAVFEDAAGWAMQSPVIDRDYDFDKFVFKLSPRMVLDHERWEHDEDLLRHSVEISRELIRLFRVDCALVVETYTISRFASPGEPASFLHGGLLLDCVLEHVRKAIEGGIGLQDLGRRRGVPHAVARPL
jgi:hypothetical protein